MWHETIDLINSQNLEDAQADQSGAWYVGHLIHLECLAQNFNP